MKLYISLSFAVLLGTFVGMSDSYSASSSIHLNGSLDGSRWTVYKKGSDKNIGIAVVVRSEGVLTATMEASEGLDSGRTVFEMSVEQSPSLVEKETKKTFSNQTVSWQCKVMEGLPKTLTHENGSTVVRNIRTVKNFATPCEEKKLELLRYPPLSKQLTLVIADNLESMVFAEGRQSKPIEESSWFRFERIR